VSVQVRAAEPADLAQVGELTAHAYLADDLIEADHWYLDELRVAAKRADQATVLVAVDGERVLCTITLAPAGSAYAEIARPHESELRMLAVHHDARGRRIGELLLRAAIDRGIEEGAHAVVLSTMPTMTAAQRVYARMGLRRTPERDWAGDSGLVFLTYIAEAPGAAQ
jgi:ribosomal protein S18 acetylase RimI-like enzyme